MWSFLLPHAFPHFGSIGSNNKIKPRFACSQTAIFKLLLVVVAIDDKYDAIESQYPKEPSTLPVRLSAFVGKLGIPASAPFLELFGLLSDHFKPNLRIERAEQFIAALIQDYRLFETGIANLKVVPSDLIEAIQVAVWRDSENFNDRKRQRFLSIIGNALRSDQEIRDLATFIHDVERLGEEDISALKLLNRVMTHAKWNVNAPLHPNDFIQRTKELMNEATHGKEQGAEKSDREDFYSQCTRLAGFGLAIEIDSPARQVPTGDFCFRPSKRGYILLKLLNEMEGKEVLF